MPFTATSRPQPLGKVIVLAPGTAVKLTFNLPVGSTGNVNILENPHARHIELKCPTTNTGLTYIGVLRAGQTGLDKTLFVDVLWFLQPGEAYVIENSQQAGPYDIQSYVVDADTANNSVVANFDPS